MWEPDPDLVQSAIDQMAAQRDALSASSGETGSEVTVEALLDAAGTLCAVGLKDVARRELGDVGSLEANVVAFLASWRLDTVLDAATLLVARAPELAPLLPEDRDELVAALVGALRARDRAELLLLGAETVLGGAVPLDAHQRSVLSAFAELVRPELWRLLPVNETRAAELEWMAPEVRPRFWWRQVGASLGTGALDSLVEAASVLASFPAARPYLDALVRTFQPRERTAARGEIASTPTAGGSGLPERLRSLHPAGAASRGEGPRLRLAAERGDWRPGVIATLLVEERTSTGHSGLIEVSFSSGSPRPGPTLSENLEPVAGQIHRALLTAAEYARRWLDPFVPMPDVGLCSVTLHLERAATVEHGHSLGLATALAAVGAHFRWTARGCAATGELADNGGVIAVKGVAAKTTAVAPGEVDRLFVPRGQAQQTMPFTGEVVEVEDLDDAASRVFPIRRLSVRVGTTYVTPLCLPGGWRRATPHETPAVITAENLRQETRKVIRKLEEMGAQDGRQALVQLTIAGPVGLGASVYVGLSQRAIREAVRVLYVQLPKDPDLGGVWCDNRAFSDGLWDGPDVWPGRS